MNPSVPVRTGLIVDVIVLVIGVVAAKLNIPYALQIIVAALAVLPTLMHAAANPQLSSVDLKKGSRCDEATQKAKPQRPQPKKKTSRSKAG